MKKIITVSREFGSGGRSIAKKTAERLGYKYYDKELVRHVAEQTGFAPKFIEEQGEYAPSKNKLAYAFTVPGTAGIMGGMSAPDYLWNAQRKVILELAKEGNCVIVGRCGDYVLRDHPGTLSVFVYAPTEARIKRIMERHSVGYDEAKDLMNKTDRRRINYYNFYTGRKWGKFDHYDLMINSHLLGIEGSAQLIADMAERFKEIEDQG